MRARLVSVLGVLVALSAGCAAPWWEEPPQEPGVVRVVGMARLVRDEAAARNFAETDGRKKLAAFVQVQVRGLTELWNKSAGDAGLEGTYSDYFNNEQITSELLNTAVRGATPIKYKADKENNYYYVLLELDIDKIAEYWKKVGSAALRDETLFKTEAMKRVFREQLDKVIREYNEAARQGYVVVKNEDVKKCELH